MSGILSDQVLSLKKNERKENIRNNNERANVSSSALIHVLYTAFSPPSKHSYDSFENKISLIQGPSRLAGLSCYLSADFNGVSMIPDSGLIYLPNGV